MIHKNVCIVAELLWTMGYIDLFWTVGININLSSVFTVKANVWKCGCTFTLPGNSKVVTSFPGSLSTQLVFVTFSSELAHLSYHNKIPELDGLGINTVLSMNHPQGVTLHSTQSLFAACVPAALHTECQTLRHGEKKPKQNKKPTFPVLWVILLFAFNAVMHSFIIIACTVRNNELAIRSHVALLLCRGFLKGQRRWKVFV